MGQYYRVIFSDGNGIVTWLWGYTYHSGVKLMEHSFVNDTMMKTVEYLISPNGKYYKMQLVWAGDYAEKEPETDKNLFEMVNERPDIETKLEHESECYYRYIVNHTQQSYVDKKNPLNMIEDKYDNIIHPLSILLAESGSGGGGDYHGNNEHLCGIWARNSVSVETTIPEGFTELVPNFYE